MVAEDDTHVIYGPPPQISPIPNISLGQLMYNSLLANPNKTNSALIDALTGESISYGQLLEESCRLAESLRRNGCGMNTLISICSENSIEFFIPVIASLYIGANVSPLNNNYTDKELDYFLAMFKPRVIFCSEAVCQKFLRLKDRFPCIERIIVMDSVNEVPGAESMKGFVSESLKDVENLQSFQLAEFDSNEQVAYIMCSSGTTGLPKGVMLTHRNLLVRYMHRIDTRLSRKTRNFLGVLPLFHQFGLTTCFNSIVENQTVLVIKRFEEELFFKTIQDYKISVLWLVPPLVVLLVKSPLGDKYDLSHVEEITSGAAPLGKDIEEQLKKRLNIENVRQAYGLTEVTLASIMMGLDEMRHGSCGKVLSYMACKVRDPETGKSLGPGQVGELCFKGPMLMKGYYNNPEATSKVYTSDGWLLTGDLAYYDTDHYFFIVDRLKELIKYKAFQVAPVELEAILLSNPNVKDVGVVGLPDEEGGELPLAFVVKAFGSKITEKELVDFVAERVSPQKRLRGGVVFVSSIPKNPSGKILRRELRQMITNLHMSKL